VHRQALTENHAYTILSQYQAEYRGLVQYYQLAFNLHRLNRVQWVMEQSLTKTLAAKWRTTVHRVYRRLQTTVPTPNGPRKVLQATVERGDGKKPLVAIWGGIPLRWRPQATLEDDLPTFWNGRSELVERLLADECELCGSRVDVEVHHVRKLADLRTKGRAERPKWVEVMAARRRKTLVVCRACHEGIHAGRPRRHGTIEARDSTGGRQSPEHEREQDGGVQVRSPDLRTGHRHQS
jgi:hypothetical protein